MTTIVPLARKHLDGFESQSGDAQNEIPNDQVGRAAVLEKDGKALAICLTHYTEPYLVINAYISKDALRYPIALHKGAKSLLKGLVENGYNKIMAAALNDRSCNWLKRLGFESDGLIYGDGLRVYHYG